MTNVISRASGGIAAVGVSNYAASSPTMTNVISTASGGSFSTVGVGNEDNSSPTMNNVTATASGGSGDYGVENVNSSPTINNSAITGSTNSVYAGLGAVKVGASQLNGGPVVGSVTCAGVYDENYTFYTSTCP
jgi:hypothetical protein